MRNVEMSIEKDTLTIKINLKAKQEPSSTGKTSVVATTNGNQAVMIPGAPEGLKLGLSAYFPKKSK